MLRRDGAPHRFIAIIALAALSGGCASFTAENVSPLPPETTDVVADPEANPIHTVSFDSASNDATTEFPATGASEAVFAAPDLLTPESVEPETTTEPTVLPVELVPLPAPNDVATEAEMAVGADTTKSADEHEFPNPAPIDLSSALEISAGQNPRVAFAQERVREAYASLQSANVLWLPSIRTGFNYNKHEGKIQDVAGEIIDTSRGSIYTGFGAQAVGASSPAVPGIYMNFHLRDALFNPRIAERTLAAQRRAGQAAVNDVLLETALAYIDLLEAAQTKAVADETSSHAAKLAELTTSFAKAGQGLDSDADRAQTELAVRKVDAQRTIENVRVASARLSRLLSQDQRLTLVPDEPELTPIEMVDVEPGLQDLLAIGLTNRPELSESQLLVAAAVERLRREKAAPLVPSVLLGASYGGNGGGLGSDINRFGDRFDADVAAYWEVRNLGFGEQAGRNGAGARVQQAVFQRVQVMDQVAAEIAEAFAQVEVRKSQIETARAGIQAAENSYRLNTERIEHAQGLPIETLQSLQALDQARRLYVRTVADYNRAQFRLHRALGWPALTYSSTVAN